MKATDDPIIVEQTFDAAPDEVWKAITQIDLMHRWYFDNIPDFQPKVGFKTSFNIHHEGRNFLHLWTITKVVAGKKISYDWRFERYPGMSSAAFEIFDQKHTTTLRLTVLVHEDFPDGIPEFERESCIEGWKYFINGRLKEFLEGKL